jgi:hypothetical protein
MEREILGEKGVPCVGGLLLFFFFDFALNLARP